MKELLPLRSPTVTRREAKALLRDSLIYPLFVPTMGGSAVKLLLAGAGPKALAEELHRLTLLGSDNAAALLTLLATRDEVDASQYGSAAPERCRAAAAAGHAYAQYVMSCVHRKDGKDADARKCLASSMRGRFLPAFIELGRSGAGAPWATARHHAAWLKMLWAAHKLGHRAALMLIARRWLSGKAGLLRRVPALPLYLFAVLRAARYAARHPLSEKIFILPATKERMLRSRNS
jgi:hypothetical protein